MSKKYNKVKMYYDNNLWTIDRVKNAVAKGWITKEEYAKITGESYLEE